MSQHDVIDQTTREIDELLAMRQGFNQAYREWKEAAMARLQDALGEEVVAALEQLGPRQTPINRQHRVHIYRQRLHAQRKYLQDLKEQLA